MRQKYSSLPNFCPDLLLTSVKEKFKKPLLLDDIPTTPKKRALTIKLEEHLKPLLRT